MQSYPTCRHGLRVINGNSGWKFAWPVSVVSVESHRTAQVLLNCCAQHTPDGMTMFVCLHMTVVLLQSALYTPEQLLELMAASDYVVAALPHTPSTHELVNAAAIAAMKPNGVFINVGRGKTVEEPALIEGAVAQGWRLHVLGARCNQNE